MDTNDTQEAVVEETVEETEIDSTDWKAKYNELKGINKRLETKLSKSKIEQKVEAQVEKVLETKELDRIDRRLLRIEGITAPEEVQLVQDIMKETGKDVDSVLDSKYFKTELKAMREEQATKDATPTGTKRAGNAPRDEVEYWVAKGELPKGNPELARKVVEAKLAHAKNVNMFSDDAVIK